MIQQAKEHNPNLVEGIGDIPIHNKDFVVLMLRRNSFDSQSGRIVNFELTTCTKDPVQWLRLPEAQKNPNVFGYQELAILHNPYIKESTPKEDKIRELSEEDKERAYALHMAGKDAKEIAGELPKNIRIKDVESYLVSFKESLVDLE